MNFLPESNAAMEDEIAGMEGCWLELRQVNGKWVDYHMDEKWDIEHICSLNGQTYYPIYVKTDSPDYRDWEMVYHPDVGWLFRPDDIFRMSLDVSL
jgi:hypothetical protein